MERRWIQGKFAKNGAPPFRVDADAPEVVVDQTERGVARRRDAPGAPPAAPPASAEARWGCGGGCATS